MNIRPMDLQIMVPRAMDVAKTAAVHDQSSTLHQQQLASQTKLAVAVQQQQVQNMTPASHSKVTTEDLNQEQQKGKPHQEQEGKDASADSGDQNLAGVKTRTVLPDPIRGHKIDIKT